MKALLDTTIQIDRILGSDNRKNSIDKVLKGKELVSTTYVLGEFYKNIINDYITLYNIFLQENDIKQTGCRITENVFGRSQGRISKLFHNLAANCDYDLELIKDNLDNYLHILIERFNEELVDILDETKCNRSNASVVYEDGVPKLENISCTKKSNQCQICEFWEKRKEKLQLLLDDDKYDKELKDIIKEALNNSNNFKGQNCWKLGDTIIASEAMGLKNIVVCSSNKKDFELICNLLGVKFISPNYGAQL